MVQSRNAVWTLDFAEGDGRGGTEHAHVRLNTRAVVYMCVSVRTRAHECASLYVHMHLNTRALVFRCVCAGGFKEEGAHEGRRLCGCGGEELLHPRVTGKLISNTISPCYLVVYGQGHEILIPL